MVTYYNGKFTSCIGHIDCITFWLKTRFIMAGGESSVCGDDVFISDGLGDLHSTKRNKE